MKHFLLLNLFVLSCTTMFAQSNCYDYIPLVVEGARWDGYVHVEGWLYEHQEYHPYSIIIEGDTTINHIDYKKCHYLFPELAPTPNKYTIVAYLREDVDNQRIYALYEQSYMSPINTMWRGDLYEINAYSDNFKEVLLYDFANPENPELYTEMSDWIIPSDATYITTNDNITRRCYPLNNNDLFIEGIGYVASNGGGDLLFRFPIKAACPCNTTVNFMRYYDKYNQLVYSSPLDDVKFHESITRDNVRWEYTFRDTDFISGNTSETTFWIEMKENTKINDKYYYRCVAWSNENDTITLGYVRDDECKRQVLCRYEYDLNNEVVLYDYNNITNAAPLQQINTAFINISTENFRYSYRNHDKFTIIDDNNKTLFQIIEGIGFISDGTSYCNGHLLNYPTIPQPDSREYQIIFNRVFNPKENTTFYEIPANIENIPICNESFIAINNGAITTTQESTIEAFDLKGHKIASTQESSLSISSFTPGFYIVRAKNKSYSKTIKIFVK